MTRIVQAVVNNELEFRVYENQEVVARFTKQHHAQQFVNRLNKTAYVLVNEDNDIICAFDSEPTIEEVKDQLEASYSMDLSLSNLGTYYGGETFLIPNDSFYTHYEVYGDNFHEIITIFKTQLL